MIHIKSERELAIMRKSGQLVASILQQVCLNAGPGVPLIELDTLAEKLTRDAGAIPAFKGYLGYRHSLCTSVNAHVVHGIPSKRALKDGDIVGFDFGLVLDGFYGDSAVTIGIGEISSEAKQLLQVTKDSLYAGIDASRSGNTLKDVARAIESVVNQHGYGIVREFVGHGIGRRLHEDPQIPNYAAGASNLALKRGMTIAIEPMINLGTADVKVLADKWTAETKDGKLSAHFEHSLAITDGDPEILTYWHADTDPGMHKKLGNLQTYGQRGANPGGISHV